MRLKMIGFLFLSLIALAIMGCAVESSSPSSEPAAAEAKPLVTVRIYTLHKDAPATYRDVKIEIAASLPDDASAVKKTAERLVWDTCNPPYSGIGTDLILFHEIQMQGMYVCISGSGDLDLTNSYYQNPFLCWYASNPAACLANIRISGNIRSIWNGDATAPSACYFFDGSGNYVRYNVYPTQTYADSVAPSVLQNATVMTCF